MRPSWVWSQDWAAVFVEGTDQQRLHQLEVSKFYHASKNVKHHKYVGGISSGRQPTFSNLQRIQRRLNSRNSVIDHDRVCLIDDLFTSVLWVIGRSTEGYFGKRKSFLFSNYCDSRRMQTRPRSAIWKLHSRYGDGHVVSLTQHPQLMWDNVHAMCVYILDLIWMCKPFPSLLGICVISLELNIRIVDEVIRSRRSCRRWTHILQSWRTQWWCGSRSGSNSTSQSSLLLQPLEWPIS